MPYLTEFLIVAIAHLLAVISPGPDFALVTRNSLVYSRRTGVMAAIGLALGILVHVTYSLIGIGLIIAQSILVFTVIKLLGAGYLIYIGYKSITAKKSDLITTAVKENSNISKLAAIRTGFLTNVLNPKATLFFLSLFTQVIRPETPTWIKTAYGLEMSLATFAWFALVAVFFSSPKLKTKISQYQYYIEKATGAILIALGLKVALSSK